MLTATSPSLDQAPIAITMGDAAGIGPETIAKAYAQEPALTHGSLVVGDVATMRRASAVVAQAGNTIALPVAQISTPAQAWHCPPHCIPVLQCGAELAPVVWGQVQAHCGAFAAGCIEWAAQGAMRGSVAAVVTAPIHKEALHAAGAPYSQFPGHTEMLQAVAAAHLGIPVQQLPVRMMLVNAMLRTVLLSIHVPLQQAIAAVTYDNVLETLHITDASLRKLLGRRAHIAVAGLNPHAGEGGLFGSHEIEVIAPAIATARANGCWVSGPFAPDTVFMRARQALDHPAEFDVVLAMYHDQGLIPVKYLGVEDGVNATLGLPFVRTSPDHGTAFDIAGTGKASAASLLHALRVARAMQDAG